MKSKTAASNGGTQQATALIARMKKARGSLVAHMQRAIRLGTTREELLEVLETCMVPGGAPTFHRGLSALLDVDRA
jgi:alkylhydroperoxidase/carboxymuconolactone decarboxylase family protein YurZ